MALSKISLYYTGLLNELCIKHVMQCDIVDTTRNTIGKM